MLNSTKKKHLVPERSDPGIRQDRPLLTKNRNKTKPASITEDFEKLLAQLRSMDGAMRKQAREALVNIGKPAVPRLIQMLSSPEDQMRWEVCKALGTIMDPAAAVPLVQALRDTSMEIRWLAGEALIALEGPAVVALLKALEEHFNSIYLREGAYHVLHALERKKLLNKKTLEVLDLLRSFEPRILTAVAAKEALESLRNASDSARRKP